MLENASNILHLAAIGFAHSIGANGTICRPKGEQTFEIRRKKSGGFPIR
jgi:hypothetical protein